MRNQEADQSSSIEAGICETLNELVGGIVGLRDEQVGRRLRDVGATGEE